MSNRDNIFVFDIETIPDLEAARSLLKLETANDAEIYKAIAAYHDAEKPAEQVFLKPIFHKIVAISFANIAIDHNHEGEEYTIKEIRSGGKISSSEKDLVKGFFGYLEDHTPRLVSFNGRAFDLPVLKYRAMKYGVKTNIYKLGDKWNNYTQRYSSDWHCDLHEILTDYYASGRLKLDEACNSFGYPGKVDVDGSTVYDLFKNKQIKEIRDYCETDVLNTYLVYLSYALHYGKINNRSYDMAITEVHDFLEKNQDLEHFKNFSLAWQKYKKI